MINRSLSTALISSCGHEVTLSGYNRLSAEVKERVYDALNRVRVINYNLRVASYTMSMRNYFSSARRQQVARGIISGVTLAILFAHEMHRLIIIRIKYLG